MSLDDVFKRRSSSLKHRSEIIHDITGLPFDIRSIVGECRIDACLSRDPRFIVARHQSRSKDEITNNYSLGIVDRCTRRTRREDAYWCSGYCRRQIDLQQTSRNQGGPHADGCSAWRRFREILSPYLIESVKIG